MTKLRLLTLFLLMVYLFCEQLGYASSDSAKDSVIPEQQIKAVYLVHLSEFTTWPDEKMQLPTFNICIDAASNLVMPLTEVKANGRLIKKKPLSIQYELNVKNLSGCHIFYVEARNTKLFSDLQKQLVTASVLTVSSEEGFAENGGDIEYYLENDKVRMKANLKTLENSTLIMSSNVLKLMKIIDGF